VFAVSLQVVGNVFVAVLVGNVLSIVASRSRKSEKHRARLDGVNDLLQQ
jgi:hypothetical protein